MNSFQDSSARELLGKLLEMGKNPFKALRKAIYLTPRPSITDLLVTLSSVLLSPSRAASFRLNMHCDMVGSPA